MGQVKTGQAGPARPIDEAYYIYYRAQGDNLRINVSLYLKRGRKLPFKIILATILLVGMFLKHFSTLAYRALGAQVP